MEDKESTGQALAAPGSMARNPVHIKQYQQRISRNWNLFALCLIVLITLWGLVGVQGFVDIFKKQGSLSTIAIIFLLAGMGLAYALDPYRKDGSDILHPRTHAIMSLLYLSIISIGLAIHTVSVETDSPSPPFAWMAFFIGTLGAALGALQRLDVSDGNANMLLENLGKVKNQGSGQGDKDNDAKPGENEFVTIAVNKNAQDNTTDKIILNRDLSLKYHSRLVQQIYLSIAIGGILGVFGLIVITALPQSVSSLLPVFSSDSSASNLSNWLMMRPQTNSDYSKAVLICIVFGYSQRLSGSILNKLEQSAEQIIGDRITSVNQSSAG